MNILNLILTLCVGAAGGLLGNKIKLPTGWMLGSMIAVIALNLIFQIAWFPTEMRTVLQLASGMMIGSRISRKDILGLSKLAMPAAIIIATMLVLNITFGIIMYVASNLDMPTTLFATAPGGMMDMAIVSADLGANPAYVALLQLSRLMIIYLCMIPLYKKVTARFQKPGKRKIALSPAVAAAVSTSGAPAKLYAHYRQMRYNKNRQQKRNIRELK